MNEESALETHSHHEPRSSGEFDDAQKISLPSTREAQAAPEESTIDGIELPTTVGRTVSWDWPTLRRFADADPPTEEREESPQNSDSRAATLPGRPLFRLDGYEVMDMIGTGGMGLVYKARKLVLDNLVALKVLPPAFAGDPDRLERFIREGRIAARLNHPCLLPVLDIEWADGVPVLVMPLIDGGNLAELIRAHRSALKAKAAEGKPKHDPSTAGKRAYVQNILPLLDQLVSAMGALHDAGILHRDIKPSNCLVDVGGSLKLSDFGLARLKTGQRVTMHATGMGTPGFMSPEAWEGREDLDERADVFSLGATLFQALAFRLPYPRKRLAEDTSAVRRRFAEGIPELVDLEPLILRALEPDRTQRYSSVAFRKDWTRVRAGLLPEEYKRPSLVRRGMRWLRRRRNAAIGTTVATLCVAGALAWPIIFPPPPADPTGPQPVVLNTFEPVKRYAFVPLDPHTGVPLPNSPNARRGPGQGKREIALDVRPGLYQVVVEWPDGTFHEVYRKVPTSFDVSQAIFNVNTFQRRGNVAYLAGVVPPQKSVNDDMACFAEASKVQLWVDPESKWPQSEVEVSPFWIDTHEFSVGDYSALRQAFGMSAKPPRGMPNVASLPSDTPLVNIEWEEAAYYMELAGKRLPALPEYIRAAGGVSKPEGWRQEPNSRKWEWPILNVDDPFLDRSSSIPPIVGLRSNVAEWTSSWPSLGIGSDEAKSIANFADQRIVFGAPLSAISGQTPTQEEVEGLRVRVILPVRAHWNSQGPTRDVIVGFRGVRSVTPPFLEDETPNADSSGP